MKSSLAHKEDFTDSENTSIKHTAAKTPQASPVRAIDFDPSQVPPQIEKWLAELPKKNPRQNANRLIVAIKRLGQKKLTDDVQIDALEVYLPVALELVERLQRQFENEAIPSTVESRVPFDLAQSLLLELTRAYLATANALSSDTRPPVDTKLSSLALQRSLLLSGHVLLNGYLAYRAAPDGVWSNIYRLYQSAKRHDLLFVPVRTSDRHNQDARPTIQSSFEQIVLLCASDPKGMQLGECRRLNDLLSRTLHSAEVTDDDYGRESAGVFAFDTSSDKAPLPVAALPDLLDSATHESINCLAHIDRLREIVSTNKVHQPADQSVPSNVDELHLFNKSARRWVGKQKRGQAVRLPQVWDLPVCAGLVDTHYYAGDQKPFALFAQSARSIARTDDYTETDSASFGTDTEYELSQPHQLTPLHGTLDASVIGNLEADESHAAPGLHPIQIARVIDESENGARLRVFTGSAIRFLVGDIVSMQCGAAGSWRPGVVRWLIASERNHVDVGVEVLAAYATSVGLQPLDIHTEQGRLMPALFLPGSNSRRSSDSIIVPKSSQPMAKQFKIFESDGTSRTLKLVKPLLTTNSFDQFVVVPA